MMFSTFFQKAAGGIQPASLLQLHLINRNDPLCSTLNPAALPFCPEPAKGWWLLGPYGLPQGSEGPQTDPSTGQELLSLRSSINSERVLHPQSPRGSLRAVSLSRQLESQIFHVRTWHLVLITCSSPCLGCKGDVTPARSSCHLPLSQIVQTVGNSSFVGFLILKLLGKGFTLVNRHAPEQRYPFILFVHKYLDTTGTYRILSQTYCNVFCPLPSILGLLTLQRGAYSKLFNAFAFS